MHTITYSNILHRSKSYSEFNEIIFLVFMVILSYPKMQHVLRYNNIMIMIDIDSNE